MQSKLQLGFSSRSCVTGSEEVFTYLEPREQVNLRMPNGVFRYVDKYQEEVFLIRFLYLPCWRLPNEQQCSLPSFSYSRVTYTCMVTCFSH